MDPPSTCTGLPFPAPDTHGRGTVPEQNQQVILRAHPGHGGSGGQDPQPPRPQPNSRDGREPLEVQPEPAVSSSPHPRCLFPILDRTPHSPPSPSRLTCSVRSESGHAQDKLPEMAGEGEVEGALLVSFSYQLSLGGMHAQGGSARALQKRRPSSAARPGTQDASEGRRLPLPQLGRQGAPGLGWAPEGNPETKPKRQGQGRTGVEGQGPACSVVEFKAEDGAEGTCRHTWALTCDLRKAFKGLGFVCGRGILQVSERTPAASGQALERSGRRAPVFSLAGGTTERVTPPDRAIPELGLSFLVSKMG